MTNNDDEHRTDDIAGFFNAPGKSRNSSSCVATGRKAGISAKDSAKRKS